MRSMGTDGSSAHCLYSYKVFIKCTFTIKTFPMPVPSTCCVHQDRSCVLPGLVLMWVLWMSIGSDNKPSRQYMFCHPTLLIELHKCAGSAECMLHQKTHRLYQKHSRIVRGRWLCYLLFLSCVNFMFSSFFPHVFFRNPFLCVWTTAGAASPDQLCLDSLDGHTHTHTHTHTHFNSVF